MVSIFFHGLSVQGLMSWASLATHFPPLFLLHCCSQVATIFLRLVEIFLSNCFSACVTEVYPILLD